MSEFHPYKVLQSYGRTVHRIDLDEPPVNDDDTEPLTFAQECEAGGFTLVTNKALPRFKPTPGWWQRLLQLLFGGWRP